MLPQLFGGVRRERRQHPHQRLDRLAHDADRLGALDLAGVLDVLVGAAAGPPVTVCSLNA